MKTVKKLLCLMLVAMMLVSAMPFVASAASFTAAINLNDEFVFADYFDTITYEKCLELAGVDTSAVDVIQFVCDGATLNPGETVTLENNIFVYIWTAPKCTHANKSETVTTAATCTTDGVKTITCADCGETVGTEAITASGHNMVNGACSVCGEADGTALILTLWADEQKSSCQTITMVEGGTVPNLTKYDPAGKSGWTFDHWETKDGTVLNAGAKWSASFGTEFFPVYYRDTANDGVSKLNVYVVFYADGIKRTAAPLFSEEFTSSSKTTMFDWLKSDGGVAQIADTLSVKGYTDRFTWDNKTIYNYYPSSNEAGYAVTKADMDSNGTKNVCIKVNAKEAYMADVFVYIHKTKTANASNWVEMKGYMLGDNITLASVKTALKNAGYSYSSISMYNSAEWEEVIAGENTSPRDSIEATGVTKIHVYLNGASHNSNADTTNPKTGDMITIAVTGMALSAAAMVAMIELKKRKMI